jgi:hypothetical protein
MEPAKKERIMKRLVLTVVVVVVVTVALVSSLAGAAGPRLAPVPYAHGSEYVYSGSGERVGTLTGSGIGTQLNGDSGSVSR